MSTPDNSPKKPWAAELSKDAIKALQDAGLDGVYTGLMQSAVVRTALTGIVMMVGIKVFKVELSEAQVSDLVEVIAYLSVLIAVVFHRFRSTKKIMSVDEAVGLFRQQFVQIGERAVRRDMLAFLEKNNPKLYVVVQAQLNEMEREAEARAVGGDRAVGQRAARDRFAMGGEFRAHRRRGGIVRNLDVVAAPREAIEAPRPIAGTAREDGCRRARVGAGADLGRDPASGGGDALDQDEDAHRPRQLRIRSFSGSNSGLAPATATVTG